MVRARYSSSDTTQQCSTSSLRILIHSVYDPLAPPLFILCLITQFITILLTFHHHHLIMSSISLALSSSADTLLSILENIRRLSSFSILDAFCLTLTLSTLITAFSLTQNTPPHLLAIVATFQPTVFAYLILLDLTKLNAIQSSTSLRILLFASTIVASVYAILLIRAVTLQYSLSKVSALAGLQFALWMGFHLADLLMHRIPWSNFVVFFVGRRTDLKDKILSGFALRTCVPTTWMYAYCLSVLYQRVSVWEVDAVRTVLEVCAVLGNMYACGWYLWRSVGTEKRRQLYWRVYMWMGWVCGTRKRLCRGREQIL